MQIGVKKTGLFPLCFPFPNFEFRIGQHAFYPVNIISFRREKKKDSSSSEISEFYSGGPSRTGLEASPTNKDTIRDGGSTVLYAAFTVDTIDSVYTVDSVCTVYTSDMVYTVDIVYTVDMV